LVRPTATYVTGRSDNRSLTHSSESTEINRLGPDDNNNVRTAMSTDIESRWRVSAASATDLPQPDAPSLWRTIWLSPRLTMRALINAEHPANWMPVYLLATLGAWLDMINTYWALERLSLPAVLRSAGIACVAGFAMLWTLAWVQGEFGRFRGGTGTARQLRMAFGWAYAPMLVSALCWVPIWAVSRGPFIEEAAVHSPSQVLAWIFYLYTAVAPWWSLILLVAAVAEVHRFSLWRSIDSLACALFVIFMTGFVVFAVVGLAVETFSGS
jgi:hypothetical protein